MNVWMLPERKHFRSEESGIKRVVEAYHRYLPEFGIDLVEEGESYDLKVVHAGTNTEGVDVLHSHGWYWTGDLQCSSWEWKANANVTEAARQAKIITVPSEWVAETVRRDMRRQAVVIPHGIEWEEWQHDEPCGGYVLWTKNRRLDVCSPEPISPLAGAFSRVQFVTTFAPRRRRPNIVETGVVPHDQMKQLIQGAAVYLSTTKETFGIGTLEAMAAGVPVLGYAHGGNLTLIEHGTNGYLAEPGNEEDLIEGLAYCLNHRETLGANGQWMARMWTWEAACEKVANVYERALHEAPTTVAVIIPSYNYGREQHLGRALDSVIAQTLPPDEIIVVDDGSADGDQAEAITQRRQAEHPDLSIRYVRQENAGVAMARNKGISLASSKYICCLDADDAIEPPFLERCVRALEQDHSLGLAYTKIRHVLGNGETGVSPWPGEWDFDRQISRANQVPTCNVYRREVWENLGGYKKRYCPMGAGSEDAEFWTRIGAYGWRCKLVTPEPLFIYSLGTGRVSGNEEYHEPDWLAWHPWAKDGLHPFASLATPKRFSHPVRQYDEPAVSVIIPVGPKHEDSLEDALDSLGAQTFRKWEAIVVWDRDDMPPQQMRKAYPHVRWVGIGTNRGAGAARNFGVKMARAPFLLFLDADDYLYPDAIEKMLDAWRAEEAIIYTDYIGKAFIDDPAALDPKLAQKIVWREPDGLTAIRYEALDYDPARAQRQPHGDPSRVYTWNLITSLVPRAWHDQVGGFDEEMDSWEDVDYWWRLAKAGKCFRRVPEPLVVYHFYTGGRRDAGVAQHQHLFRYLQEKHERMEVIMCRGCGSRPRQSPPPTSRNASASMPSAATFAFQDEDFRMCVCLEPNRSQHHIYGDYVFPSRLPDIAMVGNRGGGYRIHYGFRAGGDRFLVHVKDIELGKHRFREVETPVKAPEVERQPPPPPMRMEPEKAPAPPPMAREPKREPEPEPEKEEGLAPPKRIDLGEMLAQGARPYQEFRQELVAEGKLPAVSGNGFDLQKLPGVTAKIAGAMRELGIKGPGDIVERGEAKLQEISGVGDVRARAIFNAAREALVSER